MGAYRALPTKETLMKKPNRPEHRLTQALVDEAHAFVHYCERSPNVFTRDPFFGEYAKVKLKSSRDIIAAIAEMEGSNEDVGGEDDAGELKADDAAGVGDRQSQLALSPASTDVGTVTPVDEKTDLKIDSATQSLVIDQPK